jgi:hypothetical protein
MTVLATTLVRRALRDVGVRVEHYAFTNKYKTCRTVKMYGSDDEAFNATCVAAVEALNIPGLTVKRNECRTYYGTRLSIIFRLPL